MRQPPPPHCPKCGADTWFFGTAICEYTERYQFNYICTECDRCVILNIKLDTVTDKQGRI